MLKVKPGPMPGPRTGQRFHKNMEHWLRSLGDKYAGYAKTFEENGVTLTHLPTLTDDHLKELGIESSLHRHIILAEAKRLEEKTPDQKQPEAQEKPTEEKPTQEKPYPRIILKEKATPTQEKPSQKRSCSRSPGRGCSRHRSGKQNSRSRSRSRSRSQGRGRDRGRKDKKSISRSRSRKRSGSRSKTRGAPPPKSQPPWHRQRAERPRVVLKPPQPKSQPRVVEPRWEPQKPKEAPFSFFKSAPPPKPESRWQPQQPEREPISFKVDARNASAQRPQIRTAAGAFRIFSSAAKGATGDAPTPGSAQKMSEESPNGEASQAQRMASPPRRSESPAKKCDNGSKRSRSRSPSQVRRRRRRRRRRKCSRNRSRSSNRNRSNSSRSKSNGSEKQTRPADDAKNASDKVPTIGTDAKFATFTSVDEGAADEGAADDDPFARQRDDVPPGCWKEPPREGASQTQPSETPAARKRLERSSPSVGMAMAASRAAATSTQHGSTPKTTKSQEMTPDWQRTVLPSFRGVQAPKCKSKAQRQPGEDGDFFVADVGSSADCARSSASDQGLQLRVKLSHKPLGLMLAENPSGHGCFIREVVPNGVAAGTGKFKVGDFLVDVVGPDGIVFECAWLPPDDVMKAITLTEVPITLNIRRGGPEPWKLSMAEEYAEEESQDVVMRSYPVKVIILHRLDNTLVLEARSTGDVFKVNVTPDQETRAVAKQIHSQRSLGPDVEVKLLSEDGDALDLDTAIGDAFPLSFL